MRANKKKLLAMGLSVALAIGCLSGCGGNGSSPDSKKTAVDDKKGGSSTKKKMDDLGGINVLIGDWYTTDEVGETDYAKATEKYRKDIQTKYNFKIKRSNEYSYTDMQETYVTA